MNKERALQGRSNLPLNEAGKQQAAEAAHWFRSQGIVFDHVYSSPLIRAVQTAQIVAGADAEVLTDERLLEMDYGPYEGISLLDPPEEILRFFADFAHVPAPEGMEPLSAVVSRAGSFLESLKKHRPDETILVATHAIAMKGALEYLTPDASGSFWPKHLVNCALYRTGMLEGGFCIPAEILFNI